jgi:hypothetical protein
MGGTEGKGSDWLVDCPNLPEGTGFANVYKDTV